MTDKLTLRNELQYLFTHQDEKDWAYGLLELSVAPYLMFTVSDMWNCGSTKTHYYMFGVAGNYRSNRLALSYGRTRADSTARAVYAVTCPPHAASRWHILILSKLLNSPTL